MKKIKLLLLTGVVASLLSACGSSSIVGHWETADGEREFEFFSDGTYTSEKANYAGSYSIDGNRIRLGGILMADLTYTFKVSGDTLILYHDDGDVYREYDRVN